MLPAADIAALSADLESDRVERKDSLAAGDAKDRLGQPNTFMVVVQRRP